MFCEFFFLCSFIYFFELLTTRVKMKRSFCEKKQTLLFNQTFFFHVFVFNYQIEQMELLKLQT